MTFHKFGRREFLKKAAGGGMLAGAGLAFPRFAMAQGAKIKVGLMLPYTGTYAPLGVAIENGFRLALQESGGKLGGREVEFFKVDDESEPAKATDNVNRLVTRDKVDVVIGTIPNAGLSQATGSLCAPNIIRTSFSNWQPGYGMGIALSQRTNVKNVATIAWRYAAGEESVKGFKDGYLRGGGKIAKELWIPFPNVEFQALLTEIASLRPDATYAFFAGGGAAKFLKDYAQAGLNKTIPLVGPGFLTDGILEAVGGAAQGVETALHYADDLSFKRDKEFRLAYVKAFKLQPDVYAVAGYDTGLLLAAGLKAVNGEVAQKKELIAAMEKVTVDSPRGKWRLSKAHNPIQDMYLRKVVGIDNKYEGVAVKALDDDPSAMGQCRMG